MKKTKTAKTVAHHAKHPTHAKASGALATIEKDITHLQDEINTLKHSTSKKTKAHKSTKHKSAHASKKRGLALGDSVACCAAEALAASARLQGFRVDDEDVLALYWHTASDPDAGASIMATLEAAWRYGLGGVRPASFGFAPCPDGGAVYQRVGRHGELRLRDIYERDEQVDRCDIKDVGQGKQLVHAETPAAAHFQVGHDVPVPWDASLGHLIGELLSGPVLDLPVDPYRLHDLGSLERAFVDSGAMPPRGLRHGDTLLLGVELPGPHTVLAAPDGWWSWGEPHDPAEWPDAVVEAAWAVSWS